MNIKPLADRVVIKNLEAEEKTKSGIILTAPPKRSRRSAKLLQSAPAAWWTATKSR